MTADTANLADTGLPSETLQKIRTVLAGTPRISQAILYGSRARGTASSTSDIDIALEGDTLALQDKAQLEQALDDLMLPWKIDLCLLAYIDEPSLLSNIRQDGQVLYRKP